MALPTKPESIVKKNKALLLLMLGVAVLAIGGGIAAYWLLVQRNRVLGDAPVGSQLVPQDALLVASISTDAAQWQQLQTYGTPETKAALEKQLAQLRDNLITANGYNYEQDIKPWLGETMMIAYLGSRIPTMGDTQKQVPQLLGRSFFPDLIVLPMVSPAQARLLLEKTKSQKATQFFERTYKGIPIRETHKSNAPNYSIAVLGRFLVITSNPKITERAIDTYKSGSSVATTPGYLEELPEIESLNPWAQIYLNVPVFSAVLAANSGRSLAPETVAAQQQMQGVAATVTLEPQGMNFQGISWLKPNSSQQYKVENTTPRLPRRLPADTLLALSGGNLAQMWEDYVHGTQSNPLLPITPESLKAGLKGTLGLDFESDLLSWMGDEYSLALVPVSPDVMLLPENQQAPPLGAGVVFMVKVSDRSRAEASLKQLDQVMASRYGFRVEATQVGSQSVVSWTSPFAGVSATHGWLEGNVVFLTLGAPIANTFLPEPQLALIQSPLFQQAVPTKPAPSNGQFFLDVERTINNGNLNLPQLLSAEQKMWVKAIRAIGFTGAIENKRSTRFDLFVQLKTAVIPSPTPIPSKTLTSPGVTPTPQTSSSSPGVTPTPQTSSSSPSQTQTPQASSSSSGVTPTPQPSPNSR